MAVLYIVSLLGLNVARGVLDLYFFAGRGGL
jgi:hypothetical protein